MLNRSHPLTVGFVVVFALVFLPATYVPSTYAGSVAHTVTVYGSAQITTGQSKSGGAIGLFHGSSDYLATPDSADWYFGSGDFTVDFWVRFNQLPSAGGYQIIVSQYGDYWKKAYIFIFDAGGTPALQETSAVVYDRTSIIVSGGTNTYNIIHRATFTITAPGSAQAWTTLVSLSGVTNYNVAIEVS